jgi:hypothetical protein
MIPLISEFSEHMDSHVENGPQKIRKWGEKLNDWNAMKRILYDTTNFRIFGTHGQPC